MKIYSHDHIAILYMYKLRRITVNFTADSWQAFEVLNNMEDEHVGGLKFSQGADMCSLQKTMCRGKCW
jgi:hypothetical protein